jgi:hypothetical protein
LGRTSTTPRFAPQVAPFKGGQVTAPEAADPTKARNIRETFARIFETGIGLDMPGVTSTTWAAYNAVTEWVDHHRPTRAQSTEVRTS